MKLFFYTSEQLAPFGKYENLGDQLLFSNHVEFTKNFESEQTEVINIIGATQGVVVVPKEVKTILFRWLKGEFELMERKTVDFVPIEVISDDKLDSFLGEINVVEEYDVIKKKSVSTDKVVEPEPPIIDTRSFTLTAQLELFVSGLMEFLEPVYLAAFVCIVVVVAMMGGLKSNEIDTYQKIEKDLQQGLVEQAKKEIDDKKIEDGVDKRRLLIAIHEATAAKDSPITTSEPAIKPADKPVVDTDTTEQCLYRVRNSDTANEVSKKFYGTANHFPEIWAASIRTSSQGVMEIQRMQKAADGKKNYVAYVTVGNSIQPGYILVIPNPSNRKECVTDLQVLIQMP